MQERSGELTGQAAVLEELDRGFSRTGIQSFALEGILGELQVWQRVHASLNLCNKYCPSCSHESSKGASASSALDLCRFAALPLQDVTQVA